MSSHTYRVLIDIPKLQEAFGEVSPFNISKDVKNLGITEEILKLLGKSIADELERGPHYKTYVVLFWDKDHVVNYSKIRCTNEYLKKGKSSGYRCIVLVDNNDNIAYLLHIYSHKEKDNISNNDKRQLRKLVEEYKLAKANQ